MTPLSSLDVFRSLVRLEEREGGPVLSVVVPSVDGCSTFWAAAVAAGPRDLRLRSGSMPNDDHPRERIARQIEIEADGVTYASVAGQDDCRRLLATLNEMTSDPAIVRFAGICGSTTFRTVLMGAQLETLHRLDELCGAGRVDGFFDRWPFMTSSLLAIAGRGSHTLDVVASLVHASESDVSDGIIASFDDFRDATLIPMVPDARMRDAVRLLLRRLRGIEIAKGLWLPAMFRLARAVPADWLPGDAAEAVAFEACATRIGGLVERSAGGLSAETLASSAKGRWVELLVRAHGRRGMMFMPRDVADMVNAFRDQVAVPALAQAMARRGYRFPADGSDFLTVKAGCFRLLLGGKSWPAVMRTVRHWHRDQRTLDSEIRTPGACVRWPVPFERADLDDGIFLVAIADAAGLAAEGAALHHCVGGYVSDCIRGDSVIVSVRRPGPGGSEERSSTIEFSGWRPGERWVPKVIQHRAVANEAPSEADAAAVAAFVVAWNAKPASEGDLMDVRAPQEAFDPITAAAGFDWSDGDAVANAFEQWKGFLPDEVASCGPAWFDGRIAEFVGVPSFAERPRAWRRRLTRRMIERISFLPQPGSDAPFDCRCSSNAGLVATSDLRPTR